MVAEAEKCKKKTRRRLLVSVPESHAYNLRYSMQDEELASKFEPADQEKLDKAVQEPISWLDVSQEASKEEYEEKQKELEQIANSIMQKLYGGAHVGFPHDGAGAFPCGGFPGGAPGGLAGQDADDRSGVEVD